MFSQCTLAHLFNAIQCVVFVIDGSICVYNDLPDDHCERPALPKLSRKLSHCRRQ